MQTWYWYQKVAYSIVHQGSLWIMLSFIMASIIMWRIMLAAADEKEARFAHRIVQVYSAAALANAILGALLS